MSKKQYIIDENERRIRAIMGMLRDYETCTARGEFSCLDGFSNGIEREAKALKHNGKLLFSIGGDGIDEN